MYQFWYDCMEPKYGDNVKLCYMDTDIFAMHTKTEDFYEDIANDVEPTGKKKKVIGLMKDYDRICCFKTKNLFILNR